MPLTFNTVLDRMRSVRQQQAGPLPFVFYPYHQYPLNPRTIPPRAGIVPPVVETNRVGGMLDSALGWIFLDQDEVERGRQLDSQILAFNQHLYDEGKITAEQLNQMQERVQAGGADHYNEWVGEAFGEGVQEGWEAELGLVKDTFNTAGKAFLDVGFKAIPWWVWAGAGVFALYKLGLLGDLARAGLSRTRRKIKSWA